METNHLGKAKALLVVVTLAALSYSLALLLTPALVPSRALLVLYLALLCAKVALSRNDSAQPDYRRRRETVAGNWLSAPIAEVDKSTFGKLLASRMRREPGLHVVVRGESPPTCSDALYDRELDG